jgi:hypothetical protein
VKVGRKRAPIGASQPLIRELFTVLGDGSFDDLAERSGDRAEHIRAIRRGSIQNPSFRIIVDMGAALGLKLKWVREK